MDLLHKITLGQTRVAVGHHQGIHDLEHVHLHPEELEIIRDLSPRKRNEWLASRELLYLIAELPERAICLYDDFGKPYLKGIDKYISVSHSELWCASMVSKVSCGVDIQVYSETIRRIADRFLTKDDLLKVEKAKNSLHYLHILWGAKECLYKAYGKKKLGFRENIFILSLDLDKGSGVGEIRYEGLHLNYDIYFRLLPEVAWIFCLQSPVVHKSIV